LSADRSAAGSKVPADSARINRSANWARWIAKPLVRLFAAPPMPDLEVPGLMSEPARVA